MRKVKRILFICKHNRFRSKVAEAFFNKHNKNKDYVAISAGLLPGRYPLDKLQTRVAKKFGLKLKGKPKAITTEVLMKTYLMVIVADNVPTEIFNNEKYGRKEIVWEIEDSYNDDFDETYKIISKIKEKVMELIDNPDDFVVSSSGLSNRHSRKLSNRNVYIEEMK